MIESQVLVFGDLTLDIRADVNEVPHLGDVDLGIDVAYYTDVVGRVGGSAFLVADALHRCTTANPLIISAVGEDLFGRAVLQGLVGAEIPTLGVSTVNQAPTCCVAVTYFSDGARLMIRPRTHAGRLLTSAMVSSSITSLDASAVALCFVSGYVISEAGAPAVEAIRLCCDWARGHGIPVILDLVPHEFVRFVGDIAEAESRLGATDGLVAELRTARELVPDILRDDVREEMIAAASQLARGRSLAVVQHRTADDCYSQAVAVGGGIPTIWDYPLDSPILLGVGDRLLVDALVRVGILEA